MSVEKGKKSGGMNSDRLKLEIRRASIPFLMLVVLAVVGFLNAANIIRNLSGAKFWKSYTEYRVAFDNPEGVVPGRHELRIAGVKSGYIKKASLVNGKGVLTLAIDKDDAKKKPMHTDAKVQVRPVTPLEDMYVDIISRGTPSAPVLKSGEHGQILPTSQTQSNTEIGRVLNVLDSDTRPRVQQLLSELSRGTKDRGASLRQAFAQVGPFLTTAQKATKVLAQRSKTVKGLIHNLGETSQVLGDRNQRLASFIHSGNNTLAELAKNDGPLGSTISQLPPTLSNLQTSFASLQATENRLDGALRSIRPTAKALPSGLKSLREFSSDAKPAVAALRPAVRAARPLSRALRPTANSLSTMLPKLASQTQAIDQVTNKLAKPRCRQYVGNLLSWLPSMLKFNNSDGGVKAAADARADVTVDITSFGKLAFDPAAIIEPPCYLSDTTPIHMSGLAPANTNDGG